MFRNKREKDWGIIGVAVALQMCPVPQNYPMLKERATGSIDLHVIHEIITLA